MAEGWAFGVGAQTGTKSSLPWRARGGWCSLDEGARGWGDKGPSLQGRQDDMDGWVNSPSPVRYGWVDGWMWQVQTDVYEK